MVTVDCHLHLTLTPEQVPDWWMQEMFRPYGGEFESTDGAWMVDLLDRTGIDVGLVQGADLRRTTFHPDYPLEHEVFVPNDYTAAEVAKFPDRLLGVACIDPFRDLPGAVLELERCVQELDFRSLKLVASYQHYPVNDRRLYPLYEKCIELDIPVHIFTGWTPTITAMLEYANPVLLDDLGMDFRDLRVIVVISGPWLDQGIALVAKHPNFYADMCTVGGGQEGTYDALSKLRMLGAADRVLYGSNNSDKAELGEKVAALPELYRQINTVADRRGDEPFTDAEIEGMLGGTAAKLFKIPT